jgi:hypothetical protein
MPGSIFQLLTNSLNTLSAVASRSFPGLAAH